MTKDADLIFINGHIATINNNLNFVSSVAIKDGIFIAVGNNDDSFSYKGENTKIIDLGNRTVIPGLNDSHIHIIRGGLNYNLELTQGERVVSGQRLMQATSDIFLGWERVEGIDGRRRDFYVRQLRDWKGIAEPEAMVPAGMRTFGELCGATLARAHARSGDRIAIAAYLGGGDSFDRALVTFAERYADQNEKDHQALVDAVRSGRVTAQAA
jgi:cytosine/adenosine deaminase-related metal-dependent hydrolase